MKKKLLFFIGECKHTTGFLITILLELVICLMLMSIALHMVTQTKKTTGFYNAGMADKIYIEFNNQNITLGEIKINNNVDEFATSSVIGSVDGQDVRVVTPTVVNKMPKLGLKFSKTLPNDYREIYVDELVAKDLGYEKGKFYDMVIQSDNERIQRVKVLGLIDSEKAYYCFGYSTRILTNFQEIIMCDNLNDDATVSGGMFFNKVDALALKKDGHMVMLGKELYAGYAQDGLIVYLAVVVLLLTVACMLTNYLLNIDKLRKRFAVQFLTGVTYKVLYTAELIKMFTLLVLAISINAIATIFLKSESLYGSGLANFNSLGHAIWIVGSIYLVTLCIGMFKLTKIKPLESVTDEIND